MTARRDTQEAVRWLASTQAGVLTRSQLLDAGIGRGMIYNWIDTGRLLPVFAGVYALGRPIDRFESLCVASVLAAGDEAVLSGRSAAANRGLTRPASRIEVLRPQAKRRTVRGDGPHRRFVLSIKQGALVDGDVVLRGNIPVLSVPRLLIDLAGSQSKVELRRLFIEAGRQGLLTSDCVAQTEIRSRSFKGRGELMKLLQVWSPDTGRIRSVLEAEFLMLCGRSGIPAPKTNPRVDGYEVDCLWSGSRLVVELDGRRFHDDGFAIPADRAKQKALEDRGFRVMRFTHWEVTRQPSEVARAVRAGLATA